MKDFFKYFLASLLAIIVSGILIAIISFSIMGALVSSSVNKQVAVIKDNSVLEIDLNRAISEIPQSNILSAITGGSNGYSVGLYDVIRSLESAKRDDKIKGIYIKAGGNANGWATSQQLRNALKDFKSSGKFVYAYADAISQNAYYVASVADSIFVNPLGGVELKGLSTNIMFLKGLLDKLEVEPQIFYCGKFKSATEPLRAHKMSEENRTQIAAYQRDFWSEMRVAVSEFSGLESSAIDSIVNLGLVQTSEDALRFGLVSGIRYKDEFEASLRKRLGIKEEEKIAYASLSDYKGRLSQKPSSNQIALLIAEGNIVDGKAGGVNAESVIASEDFIEEIRKVRRDSNVKAVVMRVNSPGGSALASENILRELTLLQQDKKLVVTMGDYAASGGYYIACHADSIFALPTTITGSIGVFGVMMNTQKLFNNKLGVTFDVEKTAPYADLGNTNRPMMEQEKKMIQSGVDTIYKIFKTHVAKGRGMDTAYVDSVGQGRVWTGAQALQLGLVDAIGGLNQAIAAAAQLAGLENYRVVVYPKQSTDFQKLMQVINGTSVPADVFTQAMLQSSMGKGVMNGWTQLNMLLNKPKTVWAMLPFVSTTY